MCFDATVLETENTTQIDFFKQVGVGEYTFRAWSTENANVTLQVLAGSAQDLSASPCKPSSLEHLYYFAYGPSISVSLHGMPFMRTNARSIVLLVEFNSTTVLGLRQYFTVDQVVIEPELEITDFRMLTPQFFT